MKIITVPGVEWEVGDPCWIEVLDYITGKVSWQPSEIIMVGPEAGGQRLVVKGSRVHVLTDDRGRLSPEQRGVRMSQPGPVLVGL
jgi:hypothetical protein